MEGIHKGCQICLKDTFSADEIVAKTICDHYYCVACIESWHAISKTCPTCRGKTDPAHDVKRLSKCKDCSTWIPLYDFKRHRALDCPAALQPCPICRAMVANRDRDEHAQVHFNALSTEPASPWREEEADTVVVEKLS